MEYVKPVSPEARDRLVDALRKIVRMASETEHMVAEERPCDEILDQFNGVKDAVDEIESMLISNQLEKCVIPSLAHFQQIVEALNRLIRRKHGALIVIQRKDDLAAYVQTGTPVDAVISAPLVESIFYPGNPLHDGAVMIHNNRIIAAGCVLPLSRKTLSEKGKILGMRHRAALGLAEITDALIIVVSEETQRVSLALGGHLFRLKKTANLWEEIYGTVREEIA